MTSQIFANVYLNEFDRYVRGVLKPLAYIRYGDDFILICDSQSAANSAQKSATAWLKNELSLKINPKNDAVFQVRAGIRWLGHVIYPRSPIATEKRMVLKIKQEINPQNAASYRSMHLPRKQQKQLPWRLL